MDACAGARAYICIHAYVHVYAYAYVSTQSISIHVFTYTYTYNSIEAMPLPRSVCCFCTNGVQTNGTAAPTTTAAAATAVIHTVTCVAAASRLLLRHKKGGFFAAAANCRHWSSLPLPTATIAVAHCAPRTCRNDRSCAYASPVSPGTGTGVDASIRELHSPLQMCESLHFVSELPKVRPMQLGGGGGIMVLVAKEARRCVAVQFLSKSRLMSFNRPAK